MDENSSQTIRLLQLAAGGDQQAWDDLSSRHRDRLHRMVARRIDRRVQSRFDASDIVQETYTDAFRGLKEYLEQPKMPFDLWLRSITWHKLMALLRREAGTEKRDPRRATPKPRSICTSMSPRPATDIGAP
ncbi:MAG: hypothetical protein IIA67_12145 [Planctomycetes bacterium]|nr:hypothetical protein [Planctomycetota bacterium]